MNRKSPALRIFLAAMLLFLGGCGTSSDSSTGGRPSMMGGTIPTVEVIQARLGALPLEERMSGLVRAKNQVILFAEISAPVVRVVVENGDFVQRGDPLVYLRDKQFQDQLRQAQAALQISEADAKRTQATLDELTTRLARMEQLAQRQVESQQQLEALQALHQGAQASHEQSLARISQAEANVEEQRETLRRTVVQAPISGFVGQRNVEIGMRVDTGRPLFVIGNFDELRVEVSITDRMINHIQVGQTALITLEQSDAPVIEAKVSRISPFLEAGSYTAAADIDVLNTDNVLRPGMFVAVDVLYGETEQAILLPESVLYEDPDSGVLGVYVAPSLRSETPVKEPDTYEPENLPPSTEPTPMVFKPVTVMGRGRGVVGISGIQMGDWVITVGQNLVHPAAGMAEARARPTSWERIISLQRLQDQDLLRNFMEKQQRMAEEEYPIVPPADPSPSSTQ